MTVYLKHQLFMEVQLFLAGYIVLESVVNHCEIDNNVQAMLSR